MISNTNPEKLILKTKQYELSDGLRDIQMGIYFVVFGLSLWCVFTPFWWKSIIFLDETAGTFGVWAGVIFWMVLPLLAILFAQSLIGYIRKRWLWKDSGQVKPLRNIIPWYIILIGLFGFVFILAVGMYLTPSLKTGEFYIYNLIMTAAGVSTGLLMMGTSNYLQIRRYLWMGIFGTLASCFILLEQNTLHLNPIFLGFVWGLILIIGGAIALRKSLLVQGE